jgi:hypothetical protein
MMEERIEALADDKMMYVCDSLMQMLPSIVAQNACGQVRWGLSRSALLLGWMMIVRS